MLHRESRLGTRDSGLALAMNLRRGARASPLYATQRGLTSRAVRARVERVHEQRWLGQLGRADSAARLRRLPQQLTLTHKHSQTARAASGELRQPNPLASGRRHANDPASSWGASSGRKSRRWQRLQATGEARLRSSRSAAAARPEAGAITPLRARSAQASPGWHIRRNVQSATCSETKLFEGR